MTYLLALALLGAGQDSTVFGIGVGSCAAAMQSGKETERRAWILGFWSAMNADAARSVGRNTDALGVIGEVELYCRQHPSEKLGQAVYDTYQAVRLKERR